MPNVEWNVPHTLITPQGTLLFNTPQVVGTSTGTGLFMLDAANCSAATVPRVTKQEVPQAPGSVLRRGFETGYQMTLTVQLWLEEDRLACDGDARCMQDLLDLHMRSLLNAEGLYRLRWEPTGYGDERMVDQLQLFSWQSPRTVPVVSTQYTLVSPLPYAIDLTQQLVAISDGGTDTITNVGTTEFYPVIQIQGSANFVQIDNLTTGLSIVFDDSLPGGVTVGPAQEAEIDCFKNTCVIVPGLADAMASIDPFQSEFFTIVQGPNQIQVTGADIEILYNNPWW